MTAFALVHSPLVGPTTWAGVADALRSRGDRAIVPTWDPPVPGGPRWSELAARACVVGAGEAGFDDGLVLVGHSRAGAGLPFIADRLAAAGRPIVACLFVDAVLPPIDGHPVVERPELAQLRAGLADADGILPPWPAWWPEGTMAMLVPDPDVRARIEAECPRLADAELTEPVPVPAGWPGGLPVAYLSFTYEDEAVAAERRGWVVGRAEGNHLQNAVDPEGVADLLQLMVAGLGIAR